MANADDVKKFVLYRDIKLGIPVSLIGGGGKRARSRQEGLTIGTKSLAARESAPNDARFRAHNVMMRKQ